LKSNRWAKTPLRQRFDAHRFHADDDDESMLCRDDVFGLATPIPSI
jgi:hypothetical protein